MEDVMPLRLNIGSGEFPLPGYTAIDRKLGSEAYPLACDDNSVDEIRASHVLEHFSHRDQGAVVKHWFDKLKPGGVIKIAVPDFYKVASEYVNGKPINVQGYVMGGHSDDNDRHGAIHDEESLTELLYATGFRRIRKWASDCNDCSSLPISLNLLGYKPTGADAMPTGLVACAAMARFGPAMHHRCNYDMLNALRIPFGIVSGCFWHHNLCEMMEKYIENPDVRYILTLDYDTIYATEDVLELYRLITSYPNVDAVVPLQSKRNGDETLFSIQNEDGTPAKQVFAAEFANNLTEIAWGHFGLTILDADKLRKLPRPWMVGVPNTKTGRWTAEKIDPDIYFWRNWRENGNKVYLASHVAIGHLQEVITWPAMDFRPIHQCPNDYWKDGKPAGVRI